MKNKIINENCILTLRKLNTNSLDGVITSPPYNITTKRKDCYYDNGYADIDNLSSEDYIKIRINEFKEIERCLRPKGVICYNISYHHENPSLPLILLSKMIEKTNLIVVDMISWKKPNAIPFQTSPNKLSRIVEQIYIITHKDNLKNFNANKEISSINNNTGQKFYKNYTNFIEAKNNDGYKCHLKASYSQELVNKLINVYFKEGEIIYDPFMGIGTTALSCISNNITYIGSELNKKTYDIAIKRIQEIRR